MILRLSELNRLLGAVRELVDEQQRASIEAVLRNCASNAIGGSLPDHNETLKFAREIGFVRRWRGEVKLTNEGTAFLSLNRDETYELTEDQRRLLIRSAYLSGAFRSQVLLTLKAFAPAFDKSTYRWSTVDGKTLPANAENILNQLRELGVAVVREEIFEISPTYVDAVAALLAEGSGWTQAALEEFIRERQEIGNLAEELAVTFERDRLLKAGCEVEAHCVQYVGKLKVNAGYDIESFQAASPGLQYDRFIEVKGSRGGEVRFIWSENEIKVARTLGNQYWIYFQGGIKAKEGKAYNKMLMFQNPVDSILRDTRFQVSQHGVIVESKMRGEAVTKN